jgi:hypothetical protein
MPYKMNIKIGQDIKFKLDGNWHGEGYVTDVEPSTLTLEVKLTSNCKEFEPGQEILIDENEIIKD